MMKVGELTYRVEESVYTYRVKDDGTVEITEYSGDKHRGAAILSNGDKPASYEQSDRPFINYMTYVQMRDGRKV